MPKIDPASASFLIYAGRDRQARLQGTAISWAQVGSWVEDEVFCSLSENEASSIHFF